MLKKYVRLGWFIGRLRCAPLFGRCTQFFVCRASAARFLWALSDVYVWYGLYPLCMESVGLSRAGVPYRCLKVEYQYEFNVPFAFRTLCQSIMSRGLLLHNGASPCGRSVLPQDHDDDVFHCSFHYRITYSSNGMCKSLQSIIREYAGTGAQDRVREL